MIIQQWWYIRDDDNYFEWFYLREILREFNIAIPETEMLQRSGTATFLSYTSLLFVSKMLKQLNRDIEQELLTESSSNKC